MGKHYFKCLACGREKYEHFGVKYFKLPENSERKAKWLNCINKQHLIHEKISRDSRICERHFSKDMYGKSTMRLKWSATPNLDILKNISNITEGNIDHSITSNETEGFIHVPLNEIVQMKKSLSYCESVNTPVEEADKSLSEGIAANEVFDFIVETSPKGHKPTQTSFTESEKNNRQKKKMQIPDETANAVPNQNQSSVKFEKGSVSNIIPQQSNQVHKSSRKLDSLALNDEARILRIREIHKRFRDKRRATETPEKAAERRAKAAESARRKRRQAKETAIALKIKRFSTEQRIETCEYEQFRIQPFNETAMNHNDVLQQISKQPAALTIKEKTEARRLKMREYNRRFREKRLAVETPEQTAARRAKIAEWMRMSRLIAKEKKLLATGQQCTLIGASVTAGQNLVSNSSSKDHMRDYFRCDLSKSQIAHENTATKITACRKNIVGNYIECSTSTWSAECSFSIKTENEDYHPAQHNPDEVVAVKSEYSQDSWSCYRGSESSFLTQEGLQDNRDFESPASIKSSRGKCNANDAILDAGVADMHSKYGAYIADRLSIANRTKSEVNIAQMLIESIMLNLLSGVYAYSINCVDANEVGQKEKAPSLPTSVTTESTVNAIVVKEEVDL